MKPLIESVEGEARPTGRRWMQMAPPSMSDKAISSALTVLGYKKGLDSVVKSALVEIVYEVLRELMPDAEVVDRWFCRYKGARLVSGFSFHDKGVYRELRFQVFSDVEESFGVTMDWIDPESENLSVETRRKTLLEYTMEELNEARRIAESIAPLIQSASASSMNQEHSDFPPPWKHRIGVAFLSIDNRQVLDLVVDAFTSGLGFKVTTHMNLGNPKIEIVVNDRHPLVFDVSPSLRTNSERVLR